MTKHTYSLTVLNMLKVLLYLYTLLALSAALPAQEQFQHDVVSEITTMKQHMAAQQQQIMAQQNLMMALQQEMKTQKQHMVALQHEMVIQKQQSMEQMTAQQQEITGLQQQVKSQKQELTNHNRHITEQRQKITGQQQQLAAQQHQITAFQHQLKTNQHLRTEQSRELTEQKQQLTAQQQQIIAFQDQMKAQKHRLIVQSQALTEQKEELTAQHQQIIALRTTLPVDKQMTRRLLEDDLVTEVGTLKQQMAAVHAAQQKQGLIVAANAHLKQTFSPGPNQRIIYDDVSMNHGNAYSTVHGMFTAPYAGTYLFSVSACSRSGHYIDLELMRNAIPVKDILAGDINYYDCASGTTLLDLQSGDTVWVRHHGASGDIIATEYPRAVSFTGLLLHAS